MDKRILWGCLAALATMLAVDLLTQVSGWKLDGPVRTPLGMIFAGGIVSTFLAMMLGGWVARGNFRWIALALGVVVWAATIATLYSMTTAHATSMTLAGILRFNALAIALSLAACWLGAVVGERLAARRAVSVA